MDDRNKKLIMVVRRQDLFGKDGDYFFDGFESHKRFDYEKRILDNHGFMTRGFAEYDPNYKQPITYTLIVNPSLKKIFAFQRSEKDKHYSERRLQGRWALGVGGHIDKEDIKVDNRNPIEIAMERELGEEVKFEEGKVESLVKLGYINYDSDLVGKVHFGVVSIAETSASEIVPKDPEIKKGRLHLIEDLDKMFSEPDYVFENWSKIIFRPLKRHLMKRVKI